MSPKETHGAWKAEPGTCETSFNQLGSVYFFSKTSNLSFAQSSLSDLASRVQMCEEGHVDRRHLADGASAPLWKGRPGAMINLLVSLHLSASPRCPSLLPAPS